VGFVRDSILSMAYVLECLALGKSCVGAWSDSLPHYTIVKDKLTCPREKVTAACEALKTTYGDAKATEGDGLRLDWPDRWVQVRASNTEPILRVIAEAPDETTAHDLCKEAMSRVEAAVSSA
jgi:phosphomannomutase